MFKYSGVTNYALRNLKNNQIYLSHPKDFNDPFEEAYDIKIKPITNDQFIEEFIKQKDSKKQFKESDIQKLINDKFSKEDFRHFMENHFDYFYRVPKMKNRDKESFFKDFDRDFEKEREYIKGYFLVLKESLTRHLVKSLDKFNNEINDVGVSCFSEEINNILMWSHYADKHKGFCIEFNKSYRPFSMAETILYGTNMPEYDFFSDDDIKHKQFFYYKSDHWKYEKELRIVTDKSNAPVPYKKESLKAIYFGLRADKTDMDIICTIAKANNPNVKFYKMEKKHSSFELEPHPCTCNITEKQPVLQE